MIRSKGFTIWVEPTGKLLENFKQTIKALSEEFGTDKFTPHVTVIGGIQKPLDEISAKTAQLANLLKPFTIELTGEVICEKNDWTRTMIILAKQTSQLMQAYQIATQVLGTNKGIFKPHISLMYSEDIPVQRRREVAMELDLKKLSGKFQVNYLTLMGNDGKVEDWRKVQKFALMS